MAAEEGTVIACDTKEKFEAYMAKGKDTGKLVIIDFTAKWCGPCRFIAPVFAGYAKEFPGAIFLTVDVDELKDVTEEYRITGMPTFVFIKNSKKVHTIVGGRKYEIHDKIVALIGHTSLEKQDLPTRGVKVRRTYKKKVVDLSTVRRSTRIKKQN